MHNAFTVRVVEGVRHIPCEPEGLVNREPTLAAETRPQALPADVGHGVVEEFPGLTRSEERHDVGMLQSRSQPHLAPEALSINFGGQLGRKDLDHHAAAERYLLGHENAAHAAAAQLALYAVSAT